jgi:hypothetical protein
MFSSYLHLEGPKETIAYGGDAKGEVIGIGDIPIFQNYSTTNVLHVDSLFFKTIQLQMFFMLIHYFSKLFNYKCSSC